jgi:hypothetical protein
MTVVFGTVAGAGGAALAKGNWWQGAIVGFTVSMFNHFAHDGGKGNSSPKNKYQKYFVVYPHRYAKYLARKENKSWYQNNVLHPEKHERTRMIKS